VRGRPVLLGCIAAAMAVAGCANQGVVEPAQSPMTLAQARTLVHDRLLRNADGESMYYSNGDKRGRLSDVRITPNEITFVVDGSVIHEPLRNLAISYRSDLAGDRTLLFNGGEVPPHGFVILFETSYTLAQVERIWQAFALLSRYAGGPPPIDQDPAFQAVAARYRSEAAKPAFPESARKFKVLAEDAVKHKRFQDAADLYGSALQAAPWWPDGHFDRALILGELGEYTAAAHEMQRYVALVPNAPDARAARDKIYIWQHDAQAATHGGQ